MFKERKYTKDMSNKEIMYVVANEFIDEVCSQALSDAEKLMSNDTVRELIIQAAEQKLSYENRRKSLMFDDAENQTDDFWYEMAVKDWKAYKTVLYDVIFRNYGSNSRNA